MAPPLFDCNSAVASEVEPVSAWPYVRTPFILPNAPDVVNGTGTSEFWVGEGCGPYVPWICPAPSTRYGGVKIGPIATMSGPAPVPVTSATEGAASPSVMNSCAGP